MEVMKQNGQTEVGSTRLRKEVENRLGLVVDLIMIQNEISHDKSSHPTWIGTG